MKKILLAALLAASPALAEDEAFVTFKAIKPDLNLQWRKRR